MNSYRKLSLGIGILFVGLFLASVVVHSYGGQSFATVHPGNMQMSGVTVSPFPNNDASKHMAEASSGYLTGLPDNNPTNNYPGINYPGSVGISF